MTTRRAPSPRFRRPAERPNVQLTPDDDAILFHVFRHRLIDAHMLRALFPARSAQGLTRRLNLLRKAGYLERPPQQMERLRDGGGSHPLVYALDRFGAERLRDTYGTDVQSNRWRQKNAEIRGRSIQHGLATTRFMVGLEVAARECGAVTIVHSDQIAVVRAGTTGTLAGLPQTLRSRVEWYGYRGEEGTAPDRLFALEHHDRPAEKNRQYIMLEIDQGTETIVPNERKLRQRSFFRDSSVLRKYVIYAAAFNSGAHRERFPIETFRVLTMTTSPGRAKQMQAAYQKYLTAGPLNVRPGFLLFTDWQSWASRQPGSMMVENGVGKPVQLF